MFGCLASAVLGVCVIFEVTTATMVLKAVCVLKGAGETSGTVYFEQEVRYYSRQNCY